MEVKKGFGYDRKASVMTKNIHFLLLQNMVMELNNFLVNRFNIRTLFILYYDRKIKIFYTKKQVASGWLNTRDKIMISFIHYKQTFILYKTNMGGK